jgi:hypothetical protein
MRMEVEIDGTAQTSEQGPRPWWPLRPGDPMGDRLMHSIRTDRGAHDRMDRGGQVLGRGPPVPQGDGDRDDPWACWHPGNDRLDQGGRRVGHAPPGTQRTNPPPLAAEGQPQLLVTGVTAQSEQAMREHAPLQGVVQGALPRRREACGLRISVEGGEKSL